MTCDYNGWNDAPEEEREWFDQHPEIWGGPVKQRTTGPIGDAAARRTARSVKRPRGGVRAR